MKKSLCCNAQATLSGYKYVCHKCGKECELLQFKCEQMTQVNVQELLWEYSRFLEKQGYMDCDYYCEEPNPIDEFMKQRG